HTPQVILLDSNAYFRLARSVHPLLGKTFGENPKFTLYVLADLDDEYFASSRLQTKFGWVNNAEYRNDRKVKRYTYRGAKRKDVENAFSFFAAYTKEHATSVSRVDLKALAVGFARKFPVVSDDAELCKIGRLYDIECWSVLKLLKVMLSAGRINSDDVKTVLEYLNYENDLPMSKVELRKSFRHYFGTDCPI
ncbi:MAG: hypothetical protein P8123_09375, partial [bacterium]